MLEPMGLTEISTFRAAAMKDSSHASAQVRTAAVGLNRFIDSHEFHRLKAERLEKENRRLREGLAAAELYLKDRAAKRYPDAVRLREQVLTVVADALSDADVLAGSS